MEKAVDFIKIQMKEKTYLGHDGIFVTEEEYGEFVRTDIVVNAVAHRDYGIKGTDIQIKMFDDRLEVDSPGTFAGMVKKENIRYTHFSRNPKIVAFLKDYGYVKEYGEGVDRMCRELESIGLPDPAYTHLYRKRGRLDDRLYFSMIIVNVVMAVADGLAYFLEGRDLPMVREVIIAANAVFFGAFALFAYLMMLYLHYRAYGDRERLRTVSNLGDKK